MNIGEKWKVPAMPKPADMLAAWGHGQFREVAPVPGAPAPTGSSCSPVCSRTKECQNC